MDRHYKSIRKKFNTVNRRLRIFRKNHGKKRQEESIADNLPLIKGCFYLLQKSEDIKHKIQPALLNVAPLVLPGGFFHKIW
jgi:hypothetical protein